MYSPSQPGATPDPRIISPGDLKRERLKFTDFKFRRTPGGKCSAEVELEWIDGIRVRGTSAGQSSATVDLRVAADAALRAIETFSDNSLEFELVGVKSVRAFDATVVGKLSSSSRLIVATPGSAAGASMLAVSSSSSASSAGCALVLSGADGCVLSSSVSSVSSSCSAAGRGAEPGSA